VKLPAYKAGLAGHLPVIEGLDPVYLNAHCMKPRRKLHPVMGKEKLGLSQRKGRLTV